MTRRAPHAPAYDSSLVTAASSNNRILVVGPSWVGDMVMAQSLFKWLRQRHSDSSLEVLAPAWSAPLLRRMPEVSTIIDAPFRHGRGDIFKRYRLGRKLAARGYQWAIVLPNSWKSALVPFWAGVPRRTGYLGEQRWGLINDVRRLDRQRMPMTVQRFIALAEPVNREAPTRTSIPVPDLRGDENHVTATLARFRVPAPERPVLVLCPGAEFGPAKQWPEQHFASIAKRYLTRDWEVWLLGSANDAGVAQRISALCQRRCRDFTGDTTLEQAIDLLSLASLVVSNDSGLMHVAAALGRPLVAIYGSSDPSATPPLAANSVVVTLNLDCSPCLARVCPLGHQDCLRTLAPDRVAEAAAQALGQRGVTARVQPARS